MLTKIIQQQNLFPFRTLDISVSLPLDPCMMACLPHASTKTSMMSEQNKTPGYLLSVLGNKCPRCRQGYLYKTENPYELKHKQFIEMNDKCAVCGQIFEIEPSFYFGTGYVSYALTVAFSVATFVAWWVLIGFSLDDNRLFWWMGVNAALLILLQPIFMRLSRSVWLSWFVKYDPEWRHHPPQAPERSFHS